MSLSLTGVINEPMGVFRPRVRFDASNLGSGGASGSVQVSWIIGWKVVHQTVELFIHLGHVLVRSGLKSAT